MKINEVASLLGLKTDYVISRLQATPKKGTWLETLANALDLDEYYLLKKLGPEALRESTTQLSVEQLRCLDTSTVTVMLVPMTILKAEILIADADTENQLSVLRLSLSNGAVYQFFSLDGKEFSSVVVEPLQ